MSKSVVYSEERKQFALEESSGGVGGVMPTGTDRQVMGFDESDNACAVTLGWKQLSDQPRPPDFDNGVLTMSKVDGDDEFGMIQIAVDENYESVVTPNAIPFYNPGSIGSGGGTLPVSDGIEPTDAVNMSQLPTGNVKQVVGFDSNGKMTPLLLNVAQFSDIGGTPPFSNGVLTATGISQQTGDGLMAFLEFSTDTPKAGTFPTYTAGGVLKVNNGISDKDAVNLGQLNSRAIPEAPSSGSFLLMSMDGVLTWIPN